MRALNFDTKDSWRVSAQELWIINSNNSKQEYPEIPHFSSHLSSKKYTHLPPPKKKNEESYAGI